MSSVFTKIIQGEIPCYKVAEDHSNIAFLDIRPLQRGHLLCVPKVEVDELYELPKEAYDSLMSFSQRVAKALKQSVKCKRVGSIVLGMEVPHAHIHLVPINTESELSFTNEHLNFTQAEMLELASTISDALDSVE
ncbi:MAG TPA: HIT family protein [Cryomorphaceae bacterium]|nr:HIT family protein [Cryomorphaceae bacterium]|tara:strand:- start:311 stop:715 length:405 start_codon:yes stop_codon:yes gene_type:complete